MRALSTFVLTLVALASCAAAPATQPLARLPHIEIDVPHKEVRVDCEVVKADYPLEFLAVVTNTNEYEALVHSDVRPSDLHLGLLMLGLKPGEPLHYVEESKTWAPPTGPAVRIWFEYEKDSKLERVPASNWMRDLKTKKQPADFTWVFTGSQMFPDGTYGANATGSLIGVINNELSVLDVPALKSRALEARDWERNPDTMPPTGTKVTMILSPIAPDNTASPPPTTQPRK
jgi:hypothetical protein